MSGNILGDVYHAVILDVFRESSRKKMIAGCTVGGGWSAMRKGAGMALSKALTPKLRKGERRVTQGRVSLFSSSARREIFEYLCSHPCSSTTKIARKAKCALPTAQWHIGRLCRAGYIRCRTKGGVDLFYPDRLCSENELEICAFFSRGERSAIYREVVSFPGKTADEIAYNLETSPFPVRMALKGMLGIGIISEIKDGRTKRYYPTGALEQADKRSRTGRKGFRDWLIKRLEDEKLTPKLTRASPEEIVIQVTIGRNSVEMVLRTELQNIISPD